MRYRPIGLIFAGVVTFLGVAAAGTLGSVAARPGTSIRLLPPNEWGFWTMNACGPEHSTTIRRILVVDVTTTSGR